MRAVFVDHPISNCRFGHDSNVSLRSIPLILVLCTNTQAERHGLFNAAFIQAIIMVDGSTTLHSFSPPQLPSTAASRSTLPTSRGLSLQTSWPTHPVRTTYPARHTSGPWAQAGGSRPRPKFPLPSGTRDVAQQPSHPRVHPRDQQCSSPFLGRLGRGAVQHTRLCKGPSLRLSQRARAGHGFRILRRTPGEWRLFQREVHLHAIPIIPAQILV